MKTISFVGWCWTNSTDQGKILSFPEGQVISDITNICLVERLRREGEKTKVINKIDFGDGTLWNIL